MYISNQLRICNITWLIIISNESIKYYGNVTFNVMLLQHLLRIFLCDFHHTYICNKINILSYLQNLRKRTATPERKLMILFSYYAFSATMILIHLVINLRSTDNTVQNVTSYTLCSTGGYREECNVHRENLNNGLIVSVIFDFIATLFLSLGNIVNLFYVIPVNIIRKGLDKIFFCVGSSDK